LVLEVITGIVCRNAEDVIVICARNLYLLSTAKFVVLFLGSFEGRGTGRTPGRAGPLPVGFTIKRSVVYTELNYIHARLAQQLGSRSQRELYNYLPVQC